MPLKSLKAWSEGNCADDAVNYSIRTRDPNLGETMREIGFALLLGFAGMFVAAFYTFVIGFGGIPGALLSSAAAKRSSNGVTPLWGLFLTVAGQLYASMVFVVLVIHFVESRISGATGFGKWVSWGVAFFVAIAPPAIALKDASRAQQRNVQHIAATFTAPLTAIGFFLFKLFPALTNVGWGWIPEFQ